MHQNSLFVCRMLNAIWFGKILSLLCRVFVCNSLLIFCCIFDIIFLYRLPYRSPCLGKYCPPSSEDSLYVWRHPGSLLDWDRLYHIFDKSTCLFVFWLWSKAFFVINIHARKAKIIMKYKGCFLKTRTFRPATKLCQKFNRFSPFRKLTSFLASFTAVIYTPDTE